MVFSSTVFLFLFLPVVLGAYHFARPELRNGVLLLASLAFYAWGEPLQFPVVLGSICANYVFGLLVQRYRETKPRHAKLLVALAVALNLGMLIRYKYTAFLLQGASALLGALHAGLGPLEVKAIALPLGVSFFTFHSLSYVIDVYRGHCPAQRRLPQLGLYVLLFPQLVAGPIVRYHEVSDQLAERRVRWEDFSYGVSRFVLGLGKKVLLANTLAEVADAIFRLPPGDLDLKVSWLGASAYALQIYFDFSGYSDMAVGLARMFGFRFPENFDYPYVARSMTEFWRRWHMSLSRFFRDYLYIPLGGNRVGPTRLHFNLFTVFLLCGLWHGASWNFVLWGALHGAFLVLERGGAGRLLQLAPSPVRHVYCLLVVLVTWVFFRAATLPEAIEFLRAMIGRGHGSGVVRASDFMDHQRTLAFAVGLVAMTPVLPRLQGWLRNAPLALHATASLARVGIPVVVFVVCVMRLSSGTYNPFIYFRF